MKWIHHWTVRLSLVIITLLTGGDAANDTEDLSTADAMLDSGVMRLLLVASNWTKLSSSSSASLKVTLLLSSVSPSSSLELELVSPWAPPPPQLSLGRKEVPKRSSSSSSSSSDPSELSSALADVWANLTKLGK